MRFSPGCQCCGTTTPYPPDCSACPSVPDTLYLTLTMPCAGYSGAVVTLSRVPAWDGSNSIAYFGTLPTPCGNTTRYQITSDCNNPYLDSVYVHFDCFLGTPQAAVQFMCTSSAAFGGYVPAAPAGSQNLNCPGDLSPVNVTVTMGDAGTTPGECCEDVTPTTGTAVISE